jgi:hypothetical protein
MKYELTTGTWQDDTGCPISIILVTTSDEALRVSTAINSEPPPYLSVAHIIQNLVLYIMCVHENV